jgi:hypothetical protein
MWPSQILILFCFKNKKLFYFYMKMLWTKYTHYSVLSRESKLFLGGRDSTIIISFCESSFLPTMDEQISFKNLHSREYSGHKKKVPFSSLIHFSIFPPSCALIILLGLCEIKNPSFQCFCFNSHLGIFYMFVFPKGALSGLELHWHKTCFWFCWSNCSNLAYWATWPCKLALNSSLSLWFLL